MEVNNEERSVFGQFQSTTFSTYKHQTNGTGDSVNNGSLPQPFIPAANFNLPEEPTSFYMPWSTGDNPYELMHYAQSNVKNRNLTDRECEGDVGLQGLVSNILENTRSAESCCTEGNMSILQSVWSPKTTREDSQQYFEPKESKVQPSRAFMQNHTRPSFNEAQPTTTDAEALCPQLNGFDTSDRWLFPSGNGDVDAFTPQTLAEPPGLSMSRPVKKEFSDPDDAFTAQSKMSTKSAGTFHENYAGQNGVRSRGSMALSPQELNLLVSNIQAVYNIMADDGSRGRELQNANKRTAQMHYEDGTAEQRTFVNPRMPGTPIMESQKEFGEEFAAAVQREGNGRVRKQPFQGDFGFPNGPSGLGPQHREYVPQSKLVPSSFNSPNPYQNKMASSPNGHAFLAASLNQYSQHHGQSQNNTTAAQPRVNCVPSVLPSRTVARSEFAPQRSQQMERGPPPCLQDYYQGPPPTARHHHRRPAQSEAPVNGSGGPRTGGGDLQAWPEKNAATQEGFSVQHFDGNVRPQTNGDVGEGFSQRGLPQKPCFDLARNIYGPQSFGGGHGTVGAGTTPQLTSQFLPVMFPLGDPRRSGHMPHRGSSNVHTGSSLSYGGGLPLLELRDVLPETPEFAAFNRYLGDQAAGGGAGGGAGVGPAAAPPVLWSPGGAMTQPMSQMAFYLEEAYKQWRSMEKERKRTEEFLIEAYPGKQRLGVPGAALFKGPLNPSRVDRLIMDQMQERAKVVSLLGGMERLHGFPLPANITSSLDRHHEAICLTRSRRKDEVVNRQRHAGARFREERGDASTDTLLLTAALRDLCAATRTARTALWCALQMTRPRPARGPHAGQ